MSLIHGSHSQQISFLHPQDHRAETQHLMTVLLSITESQDEIIFIDRPSLMAGQTGSEIALGNFNEQNHHQDDTRDGRATTIAPWHPNSSNCCQIIHPPPSSSITPVGLVNGWSPSSAQSPPALSISKATHPTEPTINTSSPGSSSQHQKRKREENEQTPAPALALKKLKRPGKGQSAGLPMTQAVFMPVLHPKRLRQVLNYSSVPRGRPTDIFRIQTGQPTRGDWMTEEDEEYLESRKGHR
ncbi:hypothetical protein CPB84DRAFT_1761558, partial [Gymnopilus junonius]